MIKKILNAVLALVIIWYWSDKIYYRMQDRNQEITFHPETLLPSFSNEPTIELIPGGIVLKANRQGHFTGTALINNVAMPFMIDTGATETVIPVAMANKAGLPIGRVGQSETAGGMTPAISTKISSLKIGNAEIKNINAHINYSLHEVLIGMNTLKYFSMSVKGDTMKLVSNNAEETSIIASDMTTQKTIKKWKKNVVCENEGKDCKTKYSE